MHGNRRGRIWQGAARLSGFSRLWFTCLWRPGHCPYNFQKQLTETASPIHFPQNLFAASSGDGPEENDVRSAQSVATLAR
ncbi:conserved protein of unknown function [Cupriavidus taiwanensis]|nr:hypothetical protein CBM2595_A90130 [Cupriavidus taiwanensis]SPD41993.1 conserved protein of unknown function [Cupriavidus taiwanensis]